MHKKILIPLILILFSFNLAAQDWNEIIYLDGDAQYLINEKEYEKAIDIYKKMLREIPDFSLAKYKIGLLYLKTDDQKKLAIEFLEDASKGASLDFNEKSVREVAAPIDAWLYLGEAYQIDGQIENAITNYNKFKQLISADHKLYTAVIQKLKTCENAIEAMKKPLSASIKNEGTPLNNENSNFGASISGDGNTMIFTSYTRNYIDIFSSIKKDNVWGSPKKITDYVSSKYYLKTSGLSYDGNILFLVTDEDFENEIFASVKKDGSWTNAKKLGKTINGKKTNETNASVSKDGITLYFTSDREGGYGGLDIYKAIADGKGGWGDAVNLGPSINTEFDEESPFITMDDKYLFFSSKGHNSIGGFDIFYIDLGGSGQAINLGYPVNTTGDDLFFVPDNSISSGYISRYNNSTSLGKNDIHYVSILPKISFAGNIKNEVSGEVVSDSLFNVSITNSETNEIVETISTDNGFFDFEISPGNYTLSINNEGFDPFSKQISIPSNYSESKYTYEVLLNPIVVAQEELIAEIIEEPIIEEVIEEPIIHEVVEEIKEEVIPKEKEVAQVVIEEEVVELPKEVINPASAIKEDPVKEIEKFIPSESSGNAGTINTFSVQLMALKKPVDVNFFKDVENVVLKEYPDGFYRYTVGKTDSYNEAKQTLSEIHKLGYKNAFIREDRSVVTYTIQIMALIIPVGSDYFKNLTSVDVLKGSDDYYRYSIGSYNSFNEAKAELNKIKALGYENAFVKLK